MSTQLNSTYEYQVGGALEVEAPSYVVRQADEDLYKALKAGKFCYVLNSRQMGKSSLRVRTRYRLEQENVACASIDLTGIGSEETTSEKWYTGIIYELNSNFSLEIDLRTWLREHKELNPVHRLREFIEQVLLGSVHQNIVIFVDEIDSVLGLNFGLDDFFSFIRFCYNQRADQPEYIRITFALLGVATPPDLIQNKNHTPFNIGYAIELNGFQFQEAQLLAQGLLPKTGNPQTVLREVLAWTGGQPFLTQKLCQLVLDAESLISSGEEELWIENLVRSRIIENWESQDEPEHLRTIRDRILSNKRHAGRLLGLYQQILQQGEVLGDDTPDQLELRLSGLVVEQQGKLRVYNRIYESVFDLKWVSQTLAQLRPYAEALEAWIGSNKNGSWLLRGRALRDAQVWAQDKSLSDQDYQFLAASQELDKQNVQRALEAERQAKQILAEAREKAELVLQEEKKANHRLTEAQQKAELALQEEKKANHRLTEAQQKTERIIRGGLAVAFTLAGIGGLLTIAAWKETQLAQQETQLAKDATKIEQLGATALQQFEFAEREPLKSTRREDLTEALIIEALVLAIESGQELKALLKDGRPLEDYPVSSPLLALQTIIDNLPQRKQIDTYLKKIEAKQDRVKSVRFSRDGKLLATAGKDGTVKLWNLNGTQLKLFKAHEGIVKSVRFSPTEDKLATAGDDGLVRLWNLNGTRLKSFKAHEGIIKSVNFSPDGKLLATAGDDSTVKLWNLNGRLLQEFPHPNKVESVRFSPDGKLLATVGANGMALLWDIKGKKLTEFKGHKDSVYGVSFSSDGKEVATAGDHGTIRRWDLSGNQLEEFKTFQHRVKNISYSPDGKRKLLATGGSRGTVGLWTLSGQQLAEYKGHVAYSLVESVSFSPDGKLLVTGGGDGRAIIWRVKDLDELLDEGCDELKDYFDTPSKVPKKLYVCHKK